MDYTAAAIILFCILIAVNMFWLGGKIVHIEKMLQAIMDGGKFILPKINDGMRTMELVIKAAGNFGRSLVGKAKPRHIRNMGEVKPVPDVPDWMMERFVSALLREIEVAHSMDDVKLTEPVWINGGKWKDLVGGTPKQFRACMDRLETMKIVTRGDGRNTRVWARPYGLTLVRLRQLGH